ncbi:hypothetical protein [Ruegeria sp. A3M17]|uniref:hypothetical protein n=1 Tax=Ruegeria sp. A3M17 TaxID=2267229 RepID=UPI000DE9F6BA|nr:hypothetical protein [Ruegeria sp. A3M17]RBW61811.1 hypothetical protein DS906_04505 [Ruegeria sp. A3M17]
MKPAFALSFSSTGISLHHHSDGDWFCIGEVALDAPDLNTQIIALRDQGFALENDLNCKLVIPADQVRFLSVSTEGLSPEESAEKVQAELTEATPYTLDELAFDTATVGPTTHIAAVARQTLDEARTFAAEHGFVPVQYSTPIEGQGFPSEPRFEIDTPDTVIAAEPFEVEDSAKTDEGPIADTIADSKTPTEFPSAPDTTGAVETVEVEESAKENEAPADRAIAETEDQTEIPSAPYATAAVEPVEGEEPARENDGPSIHAIADTGTPTEFRSAPNVNIAAERKATLPINRYTVPAAAAALVAGIALTVWSLTGSDDTEPSVAEAVSIKETVPNLVLDEQIAQTQEVDGDPELEFEPEAVATAPEEEPQTEPVEETAADLSATEAAILEALNVAPTQVEPVGQEPEPTEISSLAGIEIFAPEPLPDPVLESAEDLYLASLDSTDLSQDAVALPPVSSFETDLPFEQNALPAQAGVQYELDERGLVTPSAEGTLNPDGVVVYLGRPAKVPPAVPVRFEQEPIEEDPTARLAQKRPNPRPANLLESFERQQLGGRTREELAVLRPKLRPKSLQSSPRIDETPTALAVVRVPRPKTRPAGLARPASTNTSTANLGSTAAVNQSSDEAGSFQPKAVAPKIPSTASVARQATIDNALNLRKLNLIGVYGTPANRRALVRLPSGRYKKLKVGDRLDGGNVIAIGDSELRYQKRGRNLTLKMPRS